MPRRREVPKREVPLDPLYSSALVTKFISTLMRGGKRSTAEQIMYGSLASIQEKTGDDPVKVFKKAVENVKPALEVKSRRVGGSNYQVPVEVNPNRRLSLSIRWIVGFFVFSMLWANRTMVQMTANIVPQFQLFLSMIFGIVSIVLFLLLIDYSAKLLRPVSLVARIGKDAVKVVKDVYPNVIRAADMPLEQAPKHKWSLLSWEARTMTPAAPSGKKLGAPARTVLHQDSSGIVLAVNIPALLAEARRADCIVEIAPQVGDFVAVDEPLFYLYGNAGAIDDRRLRSLIAFGSERTLEQDPLFGFRSNRT